MRVFHPDKQINTGQPMRYRGSRKKSKTSIGERYRSNRWKEHQKEGICGAKKIWDVERGTREEKMKVKLALVVIGALGGQCPISWEAPTYYRNSISDPAQKC